MAIPDNLPRSPTGRIPQWVIDEAYGRTSDPGPWRAAEQTTPARAQPGRGWVVLVVAAIVLVTAFASAWSFRPWAKTSPSADVVALADEATMTDIGKDLFYDNDPRLLDAADFTGQCPSHASGCYDPARASIVVYRPSDERLHGWVVTIATHEMLHAAYDSLSRSERRDVEALLAATVATLNPVDATLEQIDGSVGGHEQSRATEQFAYVGTQVAHLEPRLEEVYARFLNDRQAVVNAYTSTATLLETMSVQLYVQQEVLAQLEAGGSADRTSAQRAVVESLSADLAALRDELSVAG